MTYGTRSPTNGSDRGSAAKCSLKIQDNISFIWLALHITLYLVSSRAGTQAPGR